MKRVGYFRFPYGDSDEMTKKHIEEKMKINKVKPEDVISIDYTQKIVWYVEDVK